MVERFSSDLGFILIALFIAAILGFIIGYLWRKNNEATNTNNEELDQLRTTNNSLIADLQKVKLENKTLNSDLSKIQADLAICKKQQGNLETKITSFTSAVSTVKIAKPTVVESNFDANKAKEVLGKRVKENDLTLVEGIGPVLSKVLIKAGINTWKDLADTQASKVKEILLRASDRHKMHDPTTWPKQASLAHQGNWKELLEYQDFLEGGKEPS